MKAELVAILAFGVCELREIPAEGEDRTVGFTGDGRRVIRGASSVFLPYEERFGEIGNVVDLGDLAAASDGEGREYVGTFGDDGEEQTTEKETR